MSAAGEPIPKTDEAAVDRSGNVRSSSVLSQAYSPPGRTEEHPKNDNDNGDDQETTEDSYDSGEGREQRYEGPGSTWRYFTQNERAIVTVLDQQRANDLSIHLYNAHALKARLYDSNTDKEAWRGKHSWIKLDDDGDMPWHPDRNWTAWPLPPDDVPRSEESFGVSSPLRFADEDATCYRVESWKPSGDLEESVEALMLRKARERFTRRYRVGAREILNRTLAQPTDEDDQEPIKEENIGSDSSVPPDVKLEEPVTSKQQPHFDRAQHDAPTFLADDERAHAILKPTVHHIISQFDDLLLGLHKSRQGHLSSTARLDDSVPHARSTSRTTKERRQSRRRSQHLTSAENSGPNGDGDGGEREDQTGAGDGDSPINSKSPTLSRRNSASGRYQLGLRDWSEVLGIASLAGWDSAVVDRAAKRCASLFGENMSFRKMPETSADASADRVMPYLPDLIPEVVLDDDAAAADVFTRHEEYTCPFADCQHFHRPYEQARRWRQHLKMRHKLEAEQIEDLEAELRRSTSTSLESEGELTKLDENDQPAETGEPSGGNAGHEAEMFGGVHVDGFLQPITINLQRGRDVKERRRRSTDVREGSKRRRLEEDAEELNDEAV